MGKGSSGVSSEVSSQEAANSSALLQIASAQNQNSQQLFSSTFPGLQKSEAYYSALSSGDPAAIMRAIAPISEQADTAASAAKANILNTGPAGGEKTLALEQVDVNRGAQVGNAATQGFNGSFNALASLAGTGISQSQSAAGLGISGINSSSQTLGTIGSQQIQAQQLQAEQKGNSLGALSSLGSDAGALFGAAGEAGGFSALFS